MRLAGGSLDDTLYEGVPPHLESALRGWLEDSTDEALLARTVARLRLKVHHISRSYSEMSPGELLDAIDFVLHAGIQPQYSFNKPKKLLATLAELLADGGSAYQINARGTGLELRVEPTVSDSVREVVRSAAESPASEHLAAAWEAVYGLHPNPPRAYSEAIKAVEAAAQPVIEPDNPTRATLGTMLRAPRNRGNAEKWSGGQWEATLAGPEGGTDLSAVWTMCRMLWKGQTSRHGSGQSTRYETRAEAEAAVHLAVLLVSWFTTGKIRRTDP